ncbi:carbohydrate sulfotransferase 1-like, partial [Hyalella azteca]|uniref:Carbohydrate sulfotransferase 1-like n=1 Tax=Hyalella azteca TaxID=294128 RepID=A0A979FR61_HYAAZ
TESTGKQLGLPTASPALPPGATNLLVLSSGPRSGSTFLGELLSLPPSTFYFYEPNQLLAKDLFVQEKISHLLSEFFNCNFSYFNFTSHHLVYRTLRHSSIRKCLVRKRCGVPDMVKMQELCRSAQRRVIKTILMPVRWIAGLTENPAENLKVVHLVRDPRGTFLSARKLGYETPDVKGCQPITEVRTSFHHNNIISKIFLEN